MALADFPLSLTVPALAGAAVPRAVRQVQFYFAGLCVVGLAAFVLGVEGRFPGGLFLYPPPVDWIPPLAREQWLVAFALHQQDTIYAACGGSQSFDEFQTLYWWEWARRASVLLLAAAAIGGGAVTAGIARFRFALPRIAGLCLIVPACALAHWLVGLAAANVADLARFNVGQYRHAVDVTFASAAVAAVLASALVPPQPQARRQSLRLAASLWGAAILIAIAFGALFMARDAAAVWPSWSGFGNVPFERFVSYQPFWLNLVFNPYGIQIVHRAVSVALFIAALGYLVRSIRRHSRGVAAAAGLFGLLTIEMAIGIAALASGVPAALSLLHRIVGVVLLAVAFTLPSSRQPLSWRPRSPATP
jgi:heme a synthase